MNSTSEKTLKQLSCFIKEAKATSSSIDKIGIIEKYKELAPIFSYTYDSNITFGVNNKSLSLKVSDRMIAYDDLIKLLNDLSTRKLSGHDAVFAVQSFTDKKDLKDALFAIVQKDLKCRCSTKLFNRAIPGCVHEFNVALANKYDEEMANKVNIFDGNWFASRKFDGCRVLSIVENNKVTTFSREGNEYKVLQNLYEPLSQLAKIYQEHKKTNQAVIFDGECAIKTKDGSDDFRSIVSLIKRTTENTPPIANPYYCIFDVLTEDEFYEIDESEKYKERYKTLTNVFHTFFNKLNLGSTILDKVSLVEQKLIVSEEDFQSYQTWYQQNKFEGLILRNGNSIYEGKRSNNMLKVKTFHSIELKCIDMEFKEMEIVDKGSQKTEKLLSHIICEYENGTVRVGSGFTQEQRRFYKDNPKEILDKIITVKYFEKTSDQRGNLSLRFPIFIGIRNYE
jgi:DNA ligase-1